MIVSNVFCICDKCKMMNIKSIVPKLKKIDKFAEIRIGCQNFCGIGRTKCFAIVNNIPVIASSSDELILKIKNSIGD